MKFICAALLSLIATGALAADDTTMTDRKGLGAAMMSALCEAKTQPTLETGSDGAVRQIYEVSTEDLHRCQYIREMSDSGCAQAGSCQNYEDWTRANPAISPTLPREAFLGALLARKTAARGQAN